jgi:imidazolonepropionase-like amidohydrolase
MLRLDNVRVFDGERVLDATSVLVDGERIVAVGPEVPASVAGRAAGEVVDGSGQTLLPGLIDAHTHVFGSLCNLRLALVYGVTTELDMFSFPPELTGMLVEIAAEDDGVADVRTAGSLVCPPGGHPAATMSDLPTLGGPADAAGFVAARLAEGSHFIKVMLDDGHHHGTALPMLDRATAAAVADAAREAGVLTVAHVCNVASVRDVVAAGIDAFTHVPLEAPMPADLVASVAGRTRFVVPTLTMMEASSATGPDRTLADDRLIAAYLPGEAAAAVRAGSDGLPVTVGHEGYDLGYALASTRALHEAGVAVLAGTDANNAPGRACPVVHGASLHRELELLVAAGLTPAEALTAATAGPADHFGLSDRGRIAPGLRADLVLVDGDPTVDITATRAIRRIWRRGAPVDRESVLADA